jgi:hypothetical protein
MSDCSRYGFGEVHFLSIAPGCESINEELCHAGEGLLS